ncbi:MAG: RNA polymerase sigma factor [Clostridia bacterium]|nr:RNA polymerase sigma factor [Clostridia bacterium]
MDNGAGSYRRFLDGDDNGFVDIIKDYKDGLILYINNFTENIFTAEDLAEDTFVKIVTKKPRFSGKSSFKTWLYAIGRNVALDYLRRTKAKEISFDELPEIKEEVLSLEQEYIKKEENITLHHAMEKLNPQYKQVLWLVYFENFSNREAATVMKKSVRNIETLLYRAKQSLKSELNKEGFEYEKL